MRPRGSNAERQEPTDRSIAERRRHGPRRADAHRPGRRPRSPSSTGPERHRPQGASCPTGTAPHGNRARRARWPDGAGACRGSPGPVACRPPHGSISAGRSPGATRRSERFAPRAATASWQRGSHEALLAYRRGVGRADDAARSTRPSRPSRRSPPAHPAHPRVLDAFDVPDSGGRLQVGRRAHPSASQLAPPDSMSFGDSFERTSSSSRSARSGLSIRNWRAFSRP